MTSDIDTALGLVEAPRVIASRIRAGSREWKPERKAYKREYGIRRRQRDQEAKHGAATRESEQRRVSIIFMVRKYEDDPRAE